MTTSVTDNASKSELIRETAFDRHFKAGRWEDYNRQFFDQLAPKYDFLNKIISFGFHDRFKREAVERIPLPLNARILDLCTGSGDIAIALALRHPTSRVCAVDASPEMLKLAEGKAKKAGVAERIDFVQGDVMKLAYPDDCFDVTVISFGLRNLIDIPQALCEFRRVTRNGGVFVNIDLGKPQGRFKTFLYEFYFRRLMPFLGRHVFHRGEFNSFQYLPDSNRYFPSPVQLADIYLKSGFARPKIYQYMLGGVSQQMVWKIRPQIPES